MTEYETNRQYAEQLTKLIMENPTCRVMVMIGTDGIDDNYSWMAGYMNRPSLERVVVGQDDSWYTKQDEPYDDCYNYYGDQADIWTDEELEQKASEIPWETVIAFNVSAT